ncbi:fibroblast growth factor-binding protein 1-like [Osmerus eperlanus]|uniref:fibroblast growth factor-binding protein 1-like n=1 Tax=Osmerus eperlanus TaxID=29151 RepID=UPI002E0D1B8B
MLFLRTLALWLFVACLAQQVLVSIGKGDGKGRKGKGGSEKSEQSPNAAPSRTERAATKGKFSTKDKLQCTWAVRGKETVTLAVTCKNPEAQVTGGLTELRCDYNAKPTTCPGFGTNPAGYWKQVARALKKLQRKLCQDERALVKAGMCKRATPDAHFKLDIGSIHSAARQPSDTVSPQKIPRTNAMATTTTTPPVRHSKGSSCTERVDQQKLAEEYCSNSWASLCTFFFSMLQSGDC